MIEELAVLQNPWWKDKGAIYEDEKVKFAISKDLKIIFDPLTENAIIIGPRQVGKTTYMKLAIMQLISRGVDPRNILYFSCDLLKDYREIVELITWFLRRTKGHAFVFLDEVTFLNDWERAIKFLLDSPLSLRMTLQVTGSTSAGLKRESFPGRNIRIVEFLPLSFSDVVDLLYPELREIPLPHPNPATSKDFYENAEELYPYFDELMRAFEVYLEVGGYPGSIKGKNLKDAVRESIFLDVLKLGRSERIALSIILGLLRRYGDRITLNSLAKELEIGSHVTIRDYLELFEELMIGRNYFQVRPENFTPLFRKERKFYFIDPLVVSSLSEMFGIAIPTSKIVEGIVGEHLSRAYPTYYLVARKEVDFVTKYFGVEVKWQSTVTPSDFPRVPIREKILLSKHDLAFHEPRNIAVIPLPLFLYQIRKSHISIRPT
ncbi:ATP-binding protein [Pyrococcus kukulkanii]|uniref:ATP-binding protein n=1 Tax=Pyrococcus kukulkanii TaxID=1609559 RepID=A0ABV4T476_9EURY